MSPGDLIDKNLAAEIKQLIESAKQSAAVSVNAKLTLLYWQVGKRVVDNLLPDDVKQVDDLAKQLTAAFGKGWTKKQLLHCVHFAKAFSDEKLVRALRKQLSWTHLKNLIYIDEPLKREFYAQIAIQERWSTRTLAERIDSQLFERTAISKKPEKTIALELAKLRENGEMNQDLILKDPYVLDFLGLNDHYLEKDLEDAILRELEQFLLELGSGFTFIARQKRIQIDDDDFYIDLLFYNRKLKRLIAIDLKVGRFKAEYKGQMELYLRWLEKYEQEAGEQPPLGIILCAGKKQEQIELLELDSAGIHVAEYLTALPPIAVFEQRLQQAVVRAKRRLALKNGDSANPQQDEQHE